MKQYSLAIFIWYWYFSWKNMFPLLLFDAVKFCTTRSVQSAFGNYRSFITNETIAHCPRSIAQNTNRPSWDYGVRLKVNKAPSHLHSSTLLGSSTNLFNFSTKRCPYPQTVICFHNLVMTLISNQRMQQHLTKLSLFICLLFFMGQPPAEMMLELSWTEISRARCTLVSVLCFNIACKHNSKCYWTKFQWSKSWARLHDCVSVFSEDWNTESKRQNTLNRNELFTVVAPVSYQWYFWNHFPFICISRYLNTWRLTTIVWARRVHFLGSFGLLGWSLARIYITDSDLWLSLTYWPTDLLPHDGVHELGHGVLQL